MAGTERQGDGIKAKRRKTFQQEERNTTGQDRTLKDLPGQKVVREDCEKGRALRKVPYLMEILLHSVQKAQSLKTQLTTLYPEHQKLLKLGN